MRPCGFDCADTLQQMVRIYLRGQTSEDLKRPFKAGGGMFGTGTQTDKASIEEAERANLLYRKEEY